jgi:hypothetical protein
VGNNDNWKTELHLRFAVTPELAAELQKKVDAIARDIDQQHVRPLRASVTGHKSPARKRADQIAVQIHEVREKLTEAQARMAEAREGAETLLFAGKDPARCETRERIARDEHASLSRRLELLTEWHADALEKADADAAESRAAAESRFAAIVAGLQTAAQQAVVAALLEHLPQIAAANMARLDLPEPAPV